jgi:hypothetical protein
MKGYTDQYGFTAGEFIVGAYLIISTHTKPHKKNQKCNWICACYTPSHTAKKGREKTLLIKYVLNSI